MKRKTKAMLVLVSFLMAFLVGSGSEGARDMPTSEEVYNPQLFWGGWPWGGIGSLGSLGLLGSLGGLAGLLGMGSPYRGMGGMGLPGWGFGGLHKAAGEFQYRGNGDAWHHGFPTTGGGSSGQVP